MSNRFKLRYAATRISTIIIRESQRTCQKAPLYMVSGIVFVEMRMFPGNNIKDSFPQKNCTTLYE
jgi:hypothetical protein